MNKSVTRRALGRGLSTLIPVDSEERGSGNEVVEIEIDAVRANPFQPRVDFNETEIKGLATSIELQGLLQPLVVRKKQDGYEIISGERRLRALKTLGRDKAPCIVRPKVTDREMLELALVENLQRENLNEIETAFAYQRLILECSISHDDLAGRVGKSRSSVSNTMRLLKLPASIQQMVRAGQISMGHARALLGITGEDRQKELARRVVADGLTVRDVEAAAQVLKSPEKKPGGSTENTRKGKPDDPDMVQLIERLQYRFGTPVKILRPDNKGGKIEIVFHDKDDLDRVIEILLGH
jgi:ParB family transcriptional regulator, chromosome partitioning protein